MTQDRRDYNLFERLLILIGRRADAKAHWHRRNPWRRNPRGRPSGITLDTVSHPCELIVVRQRNQAQIMGFLPNGLHPTRDYMRAWWPGLGEASLYSRPLARVTVFNSGEPPFLDLCTRGALRARQQPFGDAAVWLEL